MPRTVRRRPAASSKLLMRSTTKNAEACCDANGACCSGSKHSTKVLWVLFYAALGMSAAMAVAIYNVNGLQEVVGFHNARLKEMETRVMDLTNAVASNGSARTTSSANAVSPTNTIVPPATPTATVPAATTSPSAVMPSGSQSPSGALVRGSISPDGTRYAGYEEAGIRRGIGVEVAGGKVKHIVLFTKEESSGAGTATSSVMSVRWSAPNVIDYDVLVTKNGVTTKETRQIQIFF